jgi:hypothetical protein
VTSDRYDLRIEWRESPGFVKEPIIVTGPAETIAAVLRQVCDHGFALSNLKGITVREVKP